MKTPRRSTILTLACLAAMLAVSAAPIRSDAAGSMAAQPAAKTLPNSLPPKADPVMNEELMGRLIKYTRNVKGTGSIDASVCKVFDLCDGTKDMLLKSSKSDSTDGIHYFGIPPEADSKDILIGVKRDTILEVYLTDKSGKLRAAAIYENGIARLITNEKAAEKFKAELGLFAKEAAEQLPPTGINGVAR